MKWTVVFLVGLAFPLFGGDVEDASLRQLVTVKRVFVDRLTGGETAAQMRDILMSSLQGTKLFVLTENQERADAILRGAAEDLVFNEVHTSSEGINAHVNAGTGRSNSRSAGPYGGVSLGKTKATTRANAVTRRSPPSAW